MLAMTMFNRLQNAVDRRDFSSRLYVGLGKAAFWCWIVVGALWIRAHLNGHMAPMRQVMDMQT